MNERPKYTFTNETQRRAGTTNNTQRVNPNNTRKTQNTSRPTQNTTQKQNKQQYAQQQPNRKPTFEEVRQGGNNDAKGCLSFMLAFWFRSAILSLAIYLAMQFLGLIGGNDFALIKESKTGPVTFSNSQEYELTDADIEAFTALMQDEILTEEEKEVVYSLNK